MFCGLVFLIGIFAFCVAATPLDVGLAPKQITRLRAVDHHPSHRRNVQLSRPYSSLSGAVVRRNANATFSLDYQVKDDALFSGSWEVADQTLSLSLACNDCSTMGELEVSTTFPDDFEDLLENFIDDSELFDQATLGVAFKGVGANIDLSLAAGASGQFSLPLFRTESPIGVSGSNFLVGVVFSVDLVLGITGKVETKGGFQVIIPDGSSFTMPLDVTKEVAANFDGAKASLLPLSADLPANVTLALQLKIQAGLDVPDILPIDAKALAGAYINIPEVILGESFSTANASCVPAFADINLNAGAFVDIGAEIGGVDLADFNPTAATTLFSAVASTCVGAVASAASAATGADTSVIVCPTALVTETRTVTSSFAITSCAVATVNCPANMAQVISVEMPTVLVTSSCPASVAPHTTVSGGCASSVPVRGGWNVTTTTRAVVPAGAGVSLTRLTSPVTNTLTVDPSATAPIATITGSAPASTGVAKVSVTGEACSKEAGLMTSTVITSTIYTTVYPTDCSASASASLLPVFKRHDRVASSH
ncbi:hypothetical protein F5Y15DRAFT_96917 [Xylariaceae sp. FL0016]|nr:hypothetical protein F5Y15DRAFT_96917 [Xylariaceae sp. FL0016]